MRVLIVLALIAGVAAAEEIDPFDAPHGTSERGSQLFMEGRAFLKDGKRHLACERFAQSLAIEEAVGTQLNLANCREQDNKLAEAWRLFDAAARTSRAQGNTERASFAAERADRLKAKLVRIRIRLAAPIAPNTTVTVNGRLLVTQPEVEELADPGEVVVAATGPTGVLSSKRLRLDPGASVTLDVPPLHERRRYRSPLRIGTSLLLIGAGVAGIGYGLQRPNGGFVFLGTLTTTVGIVLFANAETHRVVVVPMASSSSGGLALAGSF